MTLLAAIAGTLVGLALGVAGGLWLGARVRGRPVVFWVLIAAAFVVCFFGSVAGQALRQVWLSLASLGMMAGMLTGMRYGYGQPLGPWKALDRLTNPPRKEDEPDADKPAS